MPNDGDTIPTSGLNSNGDSIPSSGGGPPFLNGGQRALHNLLLQRDSGLASMYLGGVVALRQLENPERYSQSAHSLREMLDAMPTALGFEAEAKTQAPTTHFNAPRNGGSRP